MFITGFFFFFLLFCLPSFLCTLACASVFPCLCIMAFLRGGFGAAIVSALDRHHRSPSTKFGYDFDFAFRQLQSTVPVLRLSAVEVEIRIRSARRVCTDCVVALPALQSEACVILCINSLWFVWSCWGCSGDDIFVSWFFSKKHFLFSFRCLCCKFYRNKFHQPVDRSDFTCCRWKLAGKMNFFNCLSMKLFPVINEPTVSHLKRNIGL